MKYLERSEKIISYLNSNKYASINQITDNLKNSDSTIRRDLKKLLSKGYVECIEGSYRIKKNKKLNPYENTINLLNKKNIAKKASTYIQENDSVIINGGSTCYFMHEYTDNLEFNLFTNSFVLANSFLSNEKVKISIGGGSIITTDHLIISPHEQGILNHLYATKYFLGAKSITEMGILEYDPLLINYNNSLMNRAEHTIVLADSSKFKKKEGCFASISLEKIDTLITDNGIDKNKLDMLHDHNVKVILV